MDGNLIRVFSRLTDEAEDASQPATVQRLAEEAKRRMPQDRPGDYNQALMDLGRLSVPPVRRTALPAPYRRTAWPHRPVTRKRGLSCRAKPLRNASRSTC